MKKFYLVLIFQIFIAHFALNAVCMENGLLKINVRSFSLVESHNVRLGDIAQITGDEPDVVKAAQSVFLVSAPVNDIPRFIGKSLIKISLSKNGFSLKDVKLDLPDKIIVKSKMTRISEDEIKEAIREYIYKNMPWKRDEAKVVQIDFHGDIVLPGTKIQQEIIAEENSRFIGNVPLYLEFRVNGKVLKRKRTNTKIKVLMPVVLTKVSLKKGHIISKNDIYIDKQWKSKMHSRFLTSKNEVIGKKVLRNIKATQPLMESFLKVPDDISKGDRVTIFAENKTLRITAPGIAGENGKKGEIIKVKNVDSKKMIYARIIDSTTVKVDF